MWEADFFWRNYSVFGRMSLIQSLKIGIVNITNWYYVSKFLFLYMLHVNVMLFVLQKQ